LTIRNTGLWFTHASQIWQNQQQLLHGQNRFSRYYRLIYPGHVQRDTLLDRKASTVTNLSNDSQTPVARPHDNAPNAGVPQKHSNFPSAVQGQRASPSIECRVSYADRLQSQMAYITLLEPVDHAVSPAALELPDDTHPDEVTRTVAVGASRQPAPPSSPVRMRVSGITSTGTSDGAHGHGGHDAPSWSHFASASVLLACTTLYAAIAGEIPFSCTTLYLMCPYT
jgi:Ca2+:H+ antiporter